MKVNLPVTDTEVVLRDDHMIVTETDRKGIITYVNHDFVEISGYSEQELLGVNHNIVRHPDMPPAAFQDLWNTIKAGRPWVGIVKNRSKNGGFYWVEANVTPIREGEAVVGYMSVRYKPTREQVEAADRLYREMNRGRTPPSPAPRRFRAFAELDTKARTGLQRLALLAGSVAAAGIAGWHHNLPLLGGALVLGLLLVRRLDSRATDPALSASLQQAIRALHGMAQGHYKLKVDIGGAAEVGQLLEAVKSAQIRLGFNIAETTRIAEETLRIKNALDHVSTGVMIADQDRTIIYANDSVKAMLKAAESGIRRQVPGFDADRLIGTSIDAFHGNPEHQARLLATLGSSHSASLKIGDRTMRVVVNPVFNARGQRIASAAEWTDMTEELALREKERQLAAENARVRIALDNVSTGVMIADKDRNIVYANDSVRQMLKAAEDDIRKQLPNFDAQRLVGVSIDDFHRNPAHQARLLETFQQPYTAEVALGPRRMRMVANPVFDERNERLGAVAEWTDLTLQIATQDEVAEIVAGAARGDFSKRISLAHKEGFFRRLAEDINQLMETSDRGLSNVAGVLGAIADGDLTESVDGEYQGMFGRLKDDTNRTVRQLTGIIQQIQESAYAINTAAQEIAAGNSDLSRRSEQQASSLEETAANMEQFATTVKQNTDNAIKANQMAVVASKVAGKGGEMVQQVVETMAAINESSRKVVDIIGVIDGIAFQTNILALNAAVEAARAGDQGRGFAVVAGEVRNLAQRSATYAKEIRALISTSGEQVAAGATLVEQAGVTMREIVDSVQRVADIVNEISVASREQSAGIDQVNIAVGKIEESTQQNAALVEQAAAAAESLEELAASLARSVERFRLGDSDGD
jgi:methyl-accepting chemotaxis protein